MFRNGASSFSERLEDSMEYGDRFDHCDGPDIVDHDDGGHAWVKIVLAR